MFDTLCANITSIMLILYDYSFVTTAHAILCLLLTSLLQVFWPTIFLAHKNLRQVVKDGCWRGFWFQKIGEDEKFSMAAQGSTFLKMGGIQDFSLLSLFILFLSFFLFLFSFLFFSFLFFFSFFFFSILFFLFSFHHFLKRVNVKEKQKVWCPK